MGEPLDLLGEPVGELALLYGTSFGLRTPLAGVIGMLGFALRDRRHAANPSAADYGIDAYDPVYGARPLKRAVQKYLQDPLADAILRGDIPDGTTVRVDEGDGSLVLDAGARVIGVEAWQLPAGSAAGAISYCTENASVVSPNDQPASYAARFAARISRVSCAIWGS